VITCFHQLPTVLIYTVLKRKKPEKISGITVDFKCSENLAGFQGTGSNFTTTLGVPSYRWVIPVTMGVMSEHLGGQAAKRRLLSLAFRNWDGSPKGPAPITESRATLAL